MTIYELIHFKKMVRVWKTKSPLFCLRYDPLIVFRRQNHITFIFSANGLFNAIICCAKEARALIVLDIEWVQILSQNCERLQNYRFKLGKKRTNSVRGLYDKKGPETWPETWRDETVYTPPDSSPRFTSNLNLPNTKNPAWFFILASLLDRGIQRVNWLPPRTIVARVFLNIILLSIVSLTEQC